MVDDACVVETYIYFFFLKNFRWDTKESVEKFWEVGKWKWRLNSKVKIKNAGDIKLGELLDDWLQPYLQRK